MVETPTTTQPEVDFDLSKLTPAQLRELGSKISEIKKLTKEQEAVKVKAVVDTFEDELTLITETVAANLDLVQSPTSDWAGYSWFATDLVIANPKTGAPTTYHVKVSITNVTLSNARAAQPAGDAAQGLEPWKAAPKKS